MDFTTLLESKVQVQNKLLASFLSDNTWSTPISETDGTKDSTELVTGFKPSDTLTNIKLQTNKFLVCQLGK